MTAGHRESGNRILLEWPARIPVLSNRNMWIGFLIGLAIPSVLMGGVFAWIGTPEDGLLFGAGSLLLFLLIFLIVGVVIDLAGGFRAAFRLTETGVESRGGKASTRAGEVAAVGGILAQSAGAVGAGIAAREEARVFIPWSEVRSVKARDRSRYIQIRGAFGSKPIGLYCTPDNYQNALRIVRDKTA